MGNRGVTHRLAFESPWVECQALVHGGLPLQFPEVEHLSLQVQLREHSELSSALTPANELVQFGTVQSI